MFDVHKDAPSLVERSRRKRFCPGLSFENMLRSSRGRQAVPRKGGYSFVLVIAQNRRTLLLSDVRWKRFDGTISCVLSRTTKSLHGWQTLRTGGASKRAKKGGRVPRRYTTASFSRSLCSRRGVLINTCTLVYTLYSTRIYLVFVPRFVSCVGRGINNKNCRLQRVGFFFGISLMADVPQRTIKG